MNVDIVLVCGGVFTGSSGSFNSPSYPHNYPNNANCTYDIHVPRNMKIRLVVHFFEMEQGSDKLELRQLVSGSESIVAQLSGSEISARTYTSAENRFILLFTSDYVNTRRGFRASYDAILPGKFVRIL